MSAKVIPLVEVPPCGMILRANIEWANAKRRLERRGFKVRVENGVIILVRQVRGR